MHNIERRMHQPTLCKLKGLREKCMLVNTHLFGCLTLVLKSAEAGGMVELPEECMEEGYGTGEGPSVPGGSSSKELVKRCNLHSSMVLKALGSE